MTYLPFEMYFRSMDVVSFFPHDFNKRNEAVPFSLSQPKPTELRVTQQLQDVTPLQI